jgi:hypothetical protein
MATDGEEEWRCCGRWQRKLLHKWNARQLAVRHGVPVPELYAYVPSSRRLRVESLPARYVLRPVIGTRGHGVVVMVDGRDLLTEKCLSPAALRAHLADQARSGRGPYLVEQFVSREEARDQLPLEYKCHTFGGRIEAIQVVERRNGLPGGSTHRYYHPDWSRFDDPMDLVVPLAPEQPAPPFLGEMLEAAGALGAFIGTYMRIDFFGSDSGLVFNEFSSTPAIKRLKFTPYCNELFGEVWQETCSGAI